MNRLYYRVFWIEENGILETSVPTRADMERLKEELKREGLHPYVTCDTTENFFVSGSQKVKWGEASKRNRRSRSY